MLCKKERVVFMTDKQLLELAKGEGFTAAVIAPERIPVDPKFRVFCEQNLCGKYNANYSCPPDCGTVEELHQTILAEQKALILETVWDNIGFDDTSSVQKAKMAHNASALRLLDKLQKIGYKGFASGFNGCPLCNPCKRTENAPCAFPDKRISCMSAYCVDVAELAKRCGMEFAWIPGKLYLFGMIAFHKAGE